MHPSRDAFARASTRGVSRVDPVDEGRSLWLGASIEPPQIHAPSSFVSRNVARTSFPSFQFSGTIDPIDFDGTDLISANNREMSRVVNFRNAG